MKGFLIEDFCIHEEKGKSSEALHGSAHSQECLARPFLHVGRPGKTNSFAFSPCQDKQTYYVELVRSQRKLGSFLLQLWQSASEGRDFAPSSGPRSCTGLSTSWQCLRCLRKAVYKKPKSYTACSRVPAVSGFSLNCL